MERVDEEEEEEVVLLLIVHLLLHVHNFLVIESKSSHSTLADITSSAWIAYSA